MITTCWLDVICSLETIGLSHKMWPLRFYRDDKAWANFVQLPYELLLYCVLLGFTVIKTTRKYSQNFCQFIYDVNGWLKGNIHYMVYYFSVLALAYWYWVPSLAFYSINQSLQLIWTTPGWSSVARDINQTFHLALSSPPVSQWSLCNRDCTIPAAATPSARQPPSGSLSSLVICVISKSWKQHRHLAGGESRAVQLTGRKEWSVQEWILNEIIGNWEATPVISLPSPKL